MNTLLADRMRYIGLDYLTQQPNILPFQVYKACFRKVTPIGQFSPNEDYFVNLQSSYSFKMPPKPKKNEPSKKNEAKKKDKVIEVNIKLAARPNQEVCGALPGNMGLGLSRTRPSAGGGGGSGVSLSQRFDHSLSHCVTLILSHSFLSLPSDTVKHSNLSITNTIHKPVSAGVDTNFEKLETVGLPTHNFQEPQLKFRSPNLFLQFDLHHQEKAAGVL